MSDVITTRLVNALELHELVQGGQELALLDVREPAAAGREGSLLLGVNVPASQLELRIARLVPRRSTPIVVLDGGDELDALATRTAARLGQLGYTDVRVLAGGVAGWREAGYKTHTGGIQVLGQSFGEHIEAEFATPHMSVAEVRCRIAAGEDVVLLDSRPLPEFESHSLPGGLSIPGAELVYRSADVIPSPDTLVVVNCAGRTRSIVGAQILINAGLPNPVVALEDGTMAWRLAGHDLEHGARRAAAPPTERALQVARTGARRIAERFHVTTISYDALERFRQEDDRSLYLLDIRTPEEFALGHLAGSWSTPSWDLAPWVFRHVATRNARIVLVDEPDNVRATATASWIIQLGWGEVYVLAGGHQAGPQEVGPVEPVVLGLPEEGAVPSLTPGELAARLERGGTVVLDVALSTAYRAGHVPGARFALRSRLAEALAGVPAAAALVVTSEDGVLARLAVTDLWGLTDRPVAVLAGGTAAWQQAGLALEPAGPELGEPDDVAIGAWGRQGEEQLEGFRAYLAWERGLVAELAEDDTTPFRVVR